MEDHDEMRRVVRRDQNRRHGGRRGSVTVIVMVAPERTCAWVELVAFTSTRASEKETTPGPGARIDVAVAS